MPAVRQRAKIYETQRNFDGALETTQRQSVWSRKRLCCGVNEGMCSCVSMTTRAAIKDEAQAIRLDPKLARAYFLRGAALGEIGDSRNAVSDLVDVVGLDPSLDRYVTSKGKTASITLPP